MLPLIDINKPYKLDANGNPAPEALRKIADGMEHLHRIGVEADMTSNYWNTNNPRCMGTLTPAPLR